MVSRAVGTKFKFTLSTGRPERFTVPSATTPSSITISDEPIPNVPATVIWSNVTLVMTTLSIVTLLDGFNAVIVMSVMAWSIVKSLSIVI